MSTTRGERALTLLREAAGRRARRAGRELTRPWREGREGAAAEAGRWLGLGAAVGAAVVGLAAAVYVARGGHRR